MLSSLKAGLLMATGLAGGAALCPLCGGNAAASAATARTIAVQAADTAEVRLHVSNMTCGSCPTTARVALKKLSGVYDAKVRLEDSLGVVRYDPRRVTPAEIIAHLTRLTGFGATILPDSTKAPTKPGNS